MRLRSSIRSHVPHESVSSVSVQGYDQKRVPKERQQRYAFLDISKNGDQYTGEYRTIRSSYWGQDMEINTRHGPSASGFSWNMEVPRGVRSVFQRQPPSNSINGSPVLLR